MTFWEVELFILESKIVQTLLPLWHPSLMSPCAIIVQSSASLIFDVGLTTQYTKTPVQATVSGRIRRLNTPQVCYNKMLDHLKHFKLTVPHYPPSTEVAVWVGHSTIYYIDHCPNGWVLKRTYDSCKASSPPELMVREALISRRQGAAC